jgi:hypothetical protein
MANTMRKNTDASTRDGAVRSSDETLVMRVERRGSVIRSTKTPMDIAGAISKTGDCCHQKTVLAI